MFTGLGIIVALAAAVLAHERGDVLEYDEPTLSVLYKLTSSFGYAFAIVGVIIILVGVVI